MKTFLKSALCVATVALAAPAFAEETHHPQDVAQAQPAPAQPMQPGMGPGPGGAPSMTGGPMMGSGYMMGSPMMGSPMMGNNPMMGGHMMGGPMMGGSMMGGPMMGMMQGGARIEGRLAFVKAELKVTAEQEKVWNDFAAAVRQAAAKSRDAHGMMQAMPAAAGTVTPPQMLEQHEKHLAARLDAVKTLRTAVTPFYAALTDDQRKTLAELHPMFIGMM